MFEDDLPILIFQVDTISEGINLKSCSSTILTTDSEQKATQQIGRVVRKYDYDVNGKKIEKKVANVYMFKENNEDIFDLVKKLHKYGLTDKCFTWGKKVDIKTGSGGEVSDDPVKLEKFDWMKIDETNNPTIQKIVYTFENEEKKKADEVEKLFAEVLAHYNNFPKGTIDNLMEKFSKFFDDPDEEITQAFYKELKALLKN